MPISVEHLKVVLYGTRDGGEIWSTSFAVRNTNDVFWGQAEVQEVADDIYAAWNTAWTTLKAFADASTKWIGCKAYYYPAGASTPSLSADHQGAAVVGTAAAANNHPFSVAIVCSLRSTSPSRSGRGRMYLPLSAIPMTVQGQYSSAHPGTIGSTMKTFLDAVNAAVVFANPGHLEVNIASQTTGNLTKVTRIVTDSVPDIQRRRSNKLVPITIDLRTLA